MPHIDVATAVKSLTAAGVARPLKKCRETVQVAVVVDRFGQPQVLLRDRYAGACRVAMLAGGLVIETGGTLLGGIGVSGAPGGDKDEECAKAGLDAISDKIDF